MTQMNLGVEVEEFYDEIEKDRLNPKMKVHMPHKINFL
jgi:hypothetical protein